MRLVIVESPYSGTTYEEIERNIKYARACLHDCIVRGEAPFASHLLYTQPGVLDDKVPEERNMGVTAGVAWGSVADATVVYTDFGISPGMKQGIQAAIDANRPVHYRQLEMPA